MAASYGISFKLWSVAVGIKLRRGSAISDILEVNCRVALQPTTNMDSVSMPRDSVGCTAAVTINNCGGLTSVNVGSQFRFCNCSTKLMSGRSADLDGPLTEDPRMAWFI